MLLKNVAMFQVSHEGRGITVTGFERNSFTSYAEPQTTIPNMLECHAHAVDLTKESNLHQSIYHLESGLLYLKKQDQ